MIDTTNYHDDPFLPIPNIRSSALPGAEPATFWTHFICSLTQHWFAVQLIHSENVSCLFVNTWGGEVFSRGALLPTIVQTTGFRLSSHDNITLTTSQCWPKNMLFTIIHFDHRRSISHIHYFIKPTRNTIAHQSSSRHTTWCMHYIRSSGKQGPYR